MRLTSFALVGLLALATTGCIVHGRVGATAHVESPDLVAVSPGVYVIADYHEPVFYSNGYYWLYSDGYWMRSSYYTGGWVRVRSVPVSVRRIDRPRAYVRYSARGQVYRRDSRGTVRAHSRSQPARHQPARRGPAVRDHRSAPPPRRTGPAVRDHRSAPPPRKSGPTVRDHRDDKDKDKRKKRDRD
jgi:hypothetical protein